MTTLLYGLAALFGIGLLIFIHELGHWVCARWIGVRVEVFSLGFGPRLFGFRRGATDYRISAVPLGGYVAVAGHDPGDRRWPRDQCLWSKSVGQRFVYFTGGVVMNLLFALIAFPLVFRSGVEFVAPEIGGVETGGPAWEAGLQPGDVIVEFAGKPMYSFENFGVEVALAGQRAVPIRLRRDGTETVLQVTPRFDGSAGLYDIGVTAPVEDVPPTLEVRRGSPAETAGVRSGDVLLAVNGAPARGRRAAELLAEADQSMGPSGLRLRRGEAELDVTVPASIADPSLPPRIGVRAFPRMVLGMRPGLRAVADLGLRHGDRILQVDGRPYRGPDLSVAAEGGPVLTVRVLRDGAQVDLRAEGVTPTDRAALPQHVAVGGDMEGMLLQPDPDGPAHAAGLLPGDQVVAVDRKPVRNWRDLRAAVKRAGSGEPLRFELLRDGTALVLPIAPAAQRSLGLVAELAFRRTEFRRDDLGGAVSAGCTASIDLIKQLYVTVKGMITGQVGANNLAGPIGITQISYRVAQWGPSRFLFFLAMLSINLAFINVLPIPILDGGHMLFLAIEKIKGSPVSGRVMDYSNILGLVFVLALVVFVTYNDILRLIR